MTRLGCAMATAVAAATLPTAPAAAGGPEEEFLKSIGYASTAWPWSTPQAAVNAGYTVCRSWDHDTRLEDQVSELVNATGLPAHQSSRFVSAATSYFCPEYTYKLL